MEIIGNIIGAEKKVLSDASALIAELSRLSAVTPQSAEHAVSMLAAIRDAVYENLNQIQHEYLILVAAKHLLNLGFAKETIEWSWNPRQTGGAFEPDLEGKLNGETVISAEITTSRRPIGTIAERMKSTLLKLNGFSGARYYFVRTSAMEKRANTIISCSNYQITVINLPFMENEL